MERPVRLLQGWSRLLLEPVLGFRVLDRIGGFRLSFSGRGRKQSSVLGSDNSPTDRPNAERGS